MKNKAQAAMEYLMTYGWAILILVVVVAALFAMGVFKTGTTVPCSNPCFGSQFSYVDHNTTHLILKNGARDVRLTAVTGGSLPSDVDLSSGEETTITLSSSTRPLTVTITYNVVGGTSGHTESGILRS